VKNRGNATLIIVIVGVLIFALVAFFAIRGFGLGQKALNKTGQGNVQPQPEQDVQVKALGAQSSSDEVGAIEKDSNNTNLDNLDQGIGDVDKDLGNL